MGGLVGEGIREVTAPGKPVPEFAALEAPAQLRVAQRTRPVRLAERKGAKRRRTDAVNMPAVAPIASAGAANAGMVLPDLARQMRTA
jgi:hypothetical protein